MNEKDFVILEQYELEIRGFRRGRGAFVLETDQGLKLFSEFSGTEPRLRFQNRICQQIRSQSLVRVDRILPNREGKLISRGRDERGYLVKDWFEGRECSTRSEEEILLAVRLLAGLHKAMRLPKEVPLIRSCPAAGDPARIWPMAEGAEGIRQAQPKAESGSRPSWPEAVAASLEESGPEGAARDGRQEAAVGEGAVRDGRQGAAAGEAAETDMDREEILEEGPVISDRERFRGTPLTQECAKKTRELKKVRTFMRGRSPKTAFERSFLDAFDLFFSQAASAAETAKETGCERLYQESIEAGLVCHGDYNQHHVYLSGPEMGVTDFSRARFDVQITDFYQFLRKIMEKQSWDARLGMNMLDEYSKTRPVSDPELADLRLRLAFPEKFWKLANHYYNSKKSRMPEKGLEKLGALIGQEERRQAFIRLLA